MNMDEISSIRENARDIVEKSIEFNEKMLGIAWGKYYIVWAVEISILTGFPLLIMNRYITVNYLFYSILILVSIIFTMFITKNIFYRASKNIDLIKLYGSSLNKAKHLGDILIFIYLFMLAIILTVRFRFVTFDFLLPFFAFIIFYIYMLQKLSFLHIPVEGKVAISFYAMSSILTAISLLLFKNNIYILESWFPTIVVWVAAGIYAIHHRGGDLYK